MEMHHDDLIYLTISESDQLDNQNSFTTIGRRSVSPTNGLKERSLHFCHICFKDFKDEYSVNVHVKTHTSEETFSGFSCGNCGKCFRLKAHLAKHCRTHNPNGKNGNGRKQANSPSSTVTSSVVQQQQPQQQQVQISDAVIDALTNTISEAVAETESFTGIPDFIELYHL